MSQTTAKPTELTRRQKLEVLSMRLLDHAEHHLPELNGQPLPLERLPGLAETLRTVAETEAILTGMDNEDAA